MELTIEQALQQGLKAHREGRLKDAERLYSDILRSQPSHPHANHNLGVLAVTQNKIKISLNLFEKAIESNPNVEQFWLSYIEALINENKNTRAMQVCEIARSRGVSANKLDLFEKQLASIGKNKVNDEASQEQKIIHLENTKKAPKNVEKLKNLSKSNYPSKLEIDNLVHLYQDNQLQDAEKLGRYLTRKFSSHQISWKLFGAILRRMGRAREAIDANKKAVELCPEDAEALGNLANAFKEISLFDKAEAAFKRAIALQQDYAEPYYNLGTMLQELGRLDEAIIHYKKAIELKPELIDAHNNLGTALKNQGKLDESPNNLPVST